MADIAGFPYLEFEVDKAGKPVDPGAESTIASHFALHPVTDLFVISHGWNNDTAEARALYREFFAAVREAMKNAPAVIAARSFAVGGLFWPSKKFADEELIPGGAAALGDDFQRLRNRLDELKGAFDNPKAPKIIDEAKALLPDLSTKPKARERYAQLLRSLPRQSADLKAGEAEDAPSAFFKMDGEELMQKLAKPLPVAAPAGGLGGAAGVGGAAGFFNPLDLFVSGAENLLNLTTYYQMKARAGLVGRSAVHDLLRAIQDKAPTTRLHLMGHSFGARLVTAAAMGPDGAAPLKIGTLTLMQAAFSHNGFADQFKVPGFFRKVVQEHRVAGPMLVTHSTKDLAVGVAYPLASALAGQNAESLGGPTDPFGGLGRNGAQNTTGVVSLPLTLTVSSKFKAGGMYNLNADSVIFGHSDICKPEVARALLGAVAVTG